jgi:gamma-glutamyltranspeptidase/glutathione hydrolase
MFWLDEGLPTTLPPGARPRTTLSPVDGAGRDGTGYAFGTPGGDQQDQWQATFLLR